MLACQVGTAMGALVAAERLSLTNVCEMVLAARDPDEDEPAAPGDDSEISALGVGLAVLAACLRQLAGGARRPWRQHGARLATASRVLCQWWALTSALQLRESVAYLV